MYDNFCLQDKLVIFGYIRDITINRSSISKHIIYDNVYFFLIDIYKLNFYTIKLRAQKSQELLTHITFISKYPFFKYINYLINLNNEESLIREYLLHHINIHEKYYYIVG